MRLINKTLITIGLVSVSLMSYAGTAEYYKTEPVSIVVINDVIGSGLVNVSSEDKLSGCKFRLSFKESAIVKDQDGQAFIPGRIEEGLCKGKKISKGWAFGTVSLKNDKDISFLGYIRVIVPDDDFWY
jgi:hypothetical protein